MNKCAVIIPAYNEARHIGRVISGARRFCHADIIVIDDGSDDKTGQRAVDNGAVVVRHPFNMGYGVALQTGYKYCAMHAYDAVLQMDGDDQHDPKHIPDFFGRISDGAYDLLIGSRFLGCCDYNIGRDKKLAIWLFRLAIRLISRTRITDPTSGYQCMTRKVFTVFTHNRFPYDYPDANIIVMLLQNGFRVGEMPVDMRANPEGRSMHRGLMKKANYILKTFFSIFIAVIRGRTLP
jgi:glycosyltransferase involved in cell wall biosynthesis